MSAATSVRRIMPRPRVNSRSRSSRTSAKPGNWLACGVPMPGSGRYHSAGMPPGWAELYTVSETCGSAVAALSASRTPAASRPERENCETMTGPPWAWNA